MGLAMYLFSTSRTDRNGLPFTDGFFFGRSQQDLEAINIARKELDKGRSVFYYLSWQMVESYLSNGENMSEPIQEEILDHNKRVKEFLRETDKQKSFLALFKNVNLPE